MTKPQPPSNQNARGPRAADRREAKLQEIRCWYPHFSEAEVIRVVDSDCWPSWRNYPRREGREYPYE